MHYSVLFKTGSTLGKNFRTFVPDASSDITNFKAAFLSWAEGLGQR